MYSYMLRNEFTVKDKSLDMTWVSHTCRWNMLEWNGTGGEQPECLNAINCTFNPNLQLYTFTKNVCCCVSTQTTEWPRQVRCYSERLHSLCGYFKRLLKDFFLFQNGHRWRMARWLIDERPHADVDLQPEQRKGRKKNTTIWRKYRDVCLI